MHWRHPHPNPAGGNSAINYSVQFEATTLGGVNFVIADNGTTVVHLAPKNKTGTININSGDPFTINFYATADPGISENLTLTILKDGNPEYSQTTPVVLGASLEYSGTADGSTYDVTAVEG